MIYDITRKLIKLQCGILVLFGAKVVVFFARKKYFFIYLISINSKMNTIIKTINVRVLQSKRYALKHDK